MCKELHCSRNRLTALPNLPQCKFLTCVENQLTSLPQLPVCTSLICHENTLPVNDLISWQILWRIRQRICHNFLSRKYYRRWYHFFLRAKTTRKKDLHLKLKYSPNLDFYKQDPYYQEFHRRKSQLSTEPNLN
jgi:hypothetical protein